MFLLQMTGPFKLHKPLVRSILRRRSADVAALPSLRILMLPNLLPVLSDYLLCHDLRILASLWR
jgi:hypothetical protein